MNTGFSKRRRGILAATSTLIAAAGIAAVSVAGAAQDRTIYVSDASATCFTLSPGQPPCGAGGPVDLTVQTGDTVTWDFDGSASVHNFAAAAADASNPADSTWNAHTRLPPVSSGQQKWTFGKAGSYRYVCEFHATTMYGTITVEGEEVETPTPTPTATATVESTPTARPTTSPTPAPTAAADDHTTTPAPGRASTAKDGEAPRLQSVSVKRVGAGAQVRFWLSEPATVSIGLVRKGSKSSSATAVVQAPAGTRSFVLRTKPLKRGTYTVSLAPVDAVGNKGVAAAKPLKVK
jgi:plastocyanin